MSSYYAMSMLVILLLFLVVFIVCIFRRRYVMQRTRHDEPYFRDGDNDIDHYLSREPFAVGVEANSSRSGAGRGNSRAGVAAEGIVLPNTLYHPAVLTGRVLSGVNNTNNHNNSNSAAGGRVGGMSGYYVNPLQSSLPVALPAFADETGQAVLHHLSSEGEDNEERGGTTRAAVAGAGRGSSSVYGEAYYLPRPAEAKADYTVLVDEEAKDIEEDNSDVAKRKAGTKNATMAEVAKGNVEAAGEKPAGAMGRTTSESTSQASLQETKGQSQPKAGKGSKVG